MVKENTMKQTEIGLLPGDWEVIELGDIVDYIKGYPFKSKDYCSDGVRIIRISDTTYNSIKDYGQIYVSDKVANSTKRWSLNRGDLIVSTVGSKPPMYDSMVGKVIFVKAKYAGALLNQNAVLFKNKNNSIQIILSNIFNSKRYVEFIESIYRGNANQASITLEELFKFQIPLPPLPEQEAIAEALSDADAWIESLEQLIAKKRLIKQGAMQELLSPKEDWEVKKLGEMGEIVTGNTPSTTDISNYGEDFLFISPADLGTSKYIFNSEKKLSVKGFSLSRKLKINSVLITCIGSTIGKLGITKFTSCTNQQINAIYCNENYNYGFLYYLLALNSEIIKLSASQQAVPLLNKTDFSNLEFPFPSLTEQTRIATILSDMDAELEALEGQLGKARKVKQGMMQELLTGRVRLV